MANISRRDLLKLGAGVLGGSLAANLLPNPAGINKVDDDHPNIVMLVCDAMTAKNLSVYGYPRQTTPNLEAIANRAFVYHNHHANGNFTVPGTSSLLTGLLPWTHRAINDAGVIKKEFEKHNVFQLLGDSYFKLAFSQNNWAENLLGQFASDIDVLLPSSEFGLVSAGGVWNKLTNDRKIAHHALEKMTYYQDALLLSFINGLYYQPQIQTINQTDYPKGFPIAQFYDRAFTMENLFDGLANTILELDSRNTPFFSYFHIFPPHSPYHPQKDFVGRFTNDGYEPLEKREHTLSKNYSQQRQNELRNEYDAFIANIDMEIGRLISTLNDQGILERTYFIITADHGEMFERGTVGHYTQLLYEPVIRIPLIILAPGNRIRRDIFTLTNNIDLLPTILNLAGADIPTSSEGRILPGLGGVDDTNRTIITMEARESRAYEAFSQATYAVIKDNQKLIYYHGRPHKYQDFYEFYDLDTDLEEMQDKYSNPRFAGVIEDLKAELFTAMDDANRKLSKT